MSYSRTWKCPECENTTTWSYEDLAERGTPLCTACDTEMELLPEQGTIDPSVSTRELRDPQMQSALPDGAVAPAAEGEPPGENDVIARLVEKAEAGGLEAEDLDEAVHTAASQMASDANNGGLEEQVRFLVSILGVEETRQLLEDLIDDRSR